MEISRIGDNKNLKYNHVAPIDLDTIPAEDKEQALREFSEGSLGLEKCLRSMWDNGLKTHACCAGNDSEYDIAYITMSDNVDVFSFLSDSLLSTDMIALEFSEGHQTIRFGGPVEVKEQLMTSLAYDISTGYKQNEEVVKSKIGQPLNEEWLRNGRISSMRNQGLSEEEINFRERGFELNKIFDNGNDEERDAIMSDFVDYVGQLNQKLVDRTNNIKK